MDNSIIVTPEIATPVCGLVRNDRSRVLLNKECPHGHQCRALDCMECMEIYEKVDGLEAGATDKVNTALGRNEKMEGKQEYEIL